jgi:hypothetical protein
MGNGAPKQEMFQPLFDYDSDGCYPAPAVDASGNLNGGLKNSGSLGGGCKTGHLGNANTYSRAKCDKGTGWCGIVCTLYFEKDQAAAGVDAFGHRHDWEAAVVWHHGNGEWPSYVCVSAHGDYNTKRFNDVERVGKRFKVVYHKDGAGTHAFRFAKFREQAEAWGPRQLGPSGPGSLRQPVEHEAGGLERAGELGLGQSQFPAPGQGRPLPKHPEQGQAVRHQLQRLELTPEPPSTAHRTVASNGAGARL